MNRTQIDCLAVRPEPHRKASLRFFYSRSKDSKRRLDRLPSLVFCVGFLAIEIERFQYRRIRKRKQDNAIGMDLLRAEIMTLLKQGSFTVEQLEEHINPADPELFVDVVRDMVDAGAIEYDDAWQLRVKAD